MIFKGFALAAGPRFTKISFLSPLLARILLPVSAEVIQDLQKDSLRSHAMPYAHGSMRNLDIENDHPHPDNIHDTNISTSGPRCGDELLSSYQSCQSTSPVALLHPRCGVVLIYTPKPRSHAVGFAILSAWN